MELILPALTIGGLGLYIHGKDKNNKESRQIKQENPIMPRTEDVSTEKPVSFTTVNDKYFKEEVTSMPGRFTSINGDVINTGEFKHNNMKPFFGSKVRQRGVSDENYVLDNMQGSGSEYVNKTEQEPLFKPQKNLGWNNGTPSHSDFIQSRMNPGLSKNNTKPWDEVQVGPGLNQGYTSKGSGGFNSSLESRGEWIDKTVDELRTMTNPKVTYDGVILGGKKQVTNRGVEGTVEKNRPERFYKNTQDRYLTTTGASIAQAARSKQHLGNTTRNDTTREYYGTSSGNNSGNYVKGKYSDGFKQQLNSEAPGAAYSGNHYNNNADTFTFLPNARSITEENNIFGTLVGIAKEVIMPLGETIRPSKKENVIGNLNSVGYVGVSGETYVKNNQRAKTTTKETTASNERLANIGSGIPGMGYTTNDHTPTNTQRTTTTQGYFGPSGNTQKSTNNSVYGQYYNAKLNTSKEEISTSRTNMGSMNLFNNEYNSQNTKHEREQNYVPVLNGGAHTPNMQSQGMLSSREPVRQDDRLGGELVSNLRNNPYNHSITGKV